MRVARVASTQPLRRSLDGARAAHRLRRARPGTPCAHPPGMAAVLALVMLPLIASVGFFLGVLGTGPAAALAGATFVLLAGGVLAGALQIARDGERPAADH